MKPRVDAEPSLEPRRFLIRQGVNDHAYFVTWCAGVPRLWAIAVGSTLCYFTAAGGLDYQGPGTLYFDTPEAALAWWQEKIGHSH